MQRGMRKIDAHRLNKTFGFKFLEDIHGVTNMIIHNGAQILHLFNGYGGCAFVWQGRN